MGGQVVLDNSALACILQGVGDGLGNEPSFNRVQRAGANLVRQAATFRILQRAEETIALLVTNFHRLEYIRVVESSEQHSLLSQTVGNLPAEIPPAMNHIEMDEATTACLPSQVDEVAVAGK
jgi:hypothetical protein